MQNDLLHIPCESIDNRPLTLAALNAKAYLIVNTASECGFTPQYQGLEALWRKYRDQGLQVLGFPCNQFGHQEPGTEAEIAKFCEMNYGVSFPLFKKVDVNGGNTHPLFACLKAAAPGVLGSEAIKWNFTKFLLDGKGKTVKRYASTTAPEALESDIRAMLDS